MITALALAINLGGIVAAALVFREIVADFIRPWTPARHAYRCPHLACWSCTYASSTELARHLHLQHDDTAVYALPKNGGLNRWEAVR